MITTEENTEIYFQKLGEAMYLEAAKANEASKAKEAVEYLADKGILVNDN